MKLFGWKIPFTNCNDLHEQVRCIMSTVEELQVQLQELKANAEETKSKTEAKFAAFGEKVSALQQKIDELSQGGAGATPEQLTELSGLVSEVAAVVQGTEDAADAAAPDGEPAPA